MNGSAPMWRFDTSNPWICGTNVTSFPERTADLCNVLVPLIAPQLRGRPATPGVVVVRVTLATQKFGPRGRAKGFLDALHDCRQGGTTFASMGVRPPLPDDDRRFVTGLAIEVTPGSQSHVEYRIGQGLIVNGALHRSVPVGQVAPNDIWASPAEAAKTRPARASFAATLACSWHCSVPASAGLSPGALVVRHHPTRDEDNTWATWYGALCGAAWSKASWPGGYPLGTWKPMAFASITDPNLSQPTVYEVWS